MYYHKFIYVYLFNVTMNLHNIIDFENCINFIKCVDTFKRKYKYLTKYIIIFVKSTYTTNCLSIYLLLCL